MMQPPESASTPCTILRIKRKRNEEPLDALVVESRVRRKKSRGGMDVFQFAQTVEENDWNDDKRKKDIEAQISRLAREASNKEESKPANGKQVEKAMSPIAKQQKEDVKRRYTVLEHDGGVNDTGRRLKKPPTVISAKDAVQANFKVYDAILSPEKSHPPESSSEIEKFIPLLNEYLSLHELSLHQQAKKGEEAKPAPGAREKAKDALGDNDYVWDVFYRRPAVGEWYGSGNIATLTGLPSGEDDLYGSSSDSEFEDEADEDSNAEEYYKNDYPDEEDGDSNDSGDRFSEDSDFEDLLHDQDGDDWR